MSDDRAIQQVLRRILVLNLLVAAAKLAIGFATGAISIIADGFHSLIDGLSNVVAIIAQWIAAQPPDEDHPYGHRRFEAIATFIIGGFLMLVAWEVLNTAVERLLNGGEPEVLPLSFGILIGTLCVNIGVVTYERARGKALNSRILLADANHTLTDVMVTCSVLVSLGLVSAGVVWADSVVALLIVAVIARMGWRIMAESTAVLVDKAPLPALSIEEVALQVPNVDGIAQVRSRGAGSEVYVDMDVQVKPEITADHAHNIAQTIGRNVREQFPQVREVQVTFAPQHTGAPDYPLLARAAADGLGLGVHEVVSIPGERGVMLEMHVEVNPGLTLARAHEVVSMLESRLMERPEVVEVITHIEPQSGHGAALTHSHRALQTREQALTLARTLYPDANWHDAHIRLAFGGYGLTMHCELPGSLSIEEAHTIAEQVETHIRAEMPFIQRVTIHTEPRGE